MAEDGRRSRFGVAGRLALFPARAAARATRRPLEAAADDHLVPELSRIADRAFASELPEELARSIAEHHVLERVALALAEQSVGLAEEMAAEIRGRAVELDDRIEARFRRRSRRGSSFAGVATRG